MSFLSEVGRRRFLTRSILGLGAAATGSGASPFVFANDVPSSRTMPRTPGTFRLRMRSCEEPVPKGIAYTPKFTDHDWNASETAIIVCDMWSDHPCKLAAQRVGEMAPRMNATLTRARDHGAFIVHAPSNGVEKFYADTPFRARMRDAAAVEAPVPITGNWECEPDREPELPVEANSLGEGLASGCDDPSPEPNPDFDRREHPAIQITGWDGISESGEEMWNVFQREGIRNVVLMGVHTNMCVLGRPFGIRMMSKLGFNVALCRDLTDGLYDPRDPPFVSHARGVGLIIEHIEKYWCPSFLSTDLMAVVPRSNNPE
ncbi:MAG: isochorismatase family protein [Verrucomicrobiales bacterium]|nr:isochorismatase family protein [Verrucomicrobiales bacterium]